GRNESPTALAISHPCQGILEVAAPDGPDDISREMSQVDGSFRLMHPSWRVRKVPADGFGKVDAGEAGEGEPCMRAQVRLDEIVLSRFGPVHEREAAETVEAERRTNLLELL